MLWNLHYAIFCCVATWNGHNVLESSECLMVSDATMGGHGMGIISWGKVDAYYDGHNLRQMNNDDCHDFEYYRKVHIWTIHIDSTAYCIKTNDMQMDMEVKLYKLGSIIKNALI